MMVSRQPRFALRAVNSRLLQITFLSLPQRHRTQSSLVSSFPLLRLRAIASFRETRTAMACHAAGSKITALVLGWGVEDSVVRSDSRGFGVAGAFWQCAVASIVW